jgi:hypothetical protein
MANAKISDLPAVVAIGGADLAVLVQAGTTSQTSVDDLFTDRTLVDPILGTPVSGTLTNCTGLPIVNGTTGTLSVARGGTGITAFGTGVATALGVNTGAAGAVVVNGGALGTPASGTLTNASGLPVATGISGLGTGAATALAVNVGSAGAFQPFLTDTKTNFEDIANAINTTGKYAGKQVWSTTDSLPVWAVGAAAADVWVDGTGATEYTPV